MSKSHLLVILALLGPIGSCAVVGRPAQGPGQAVLEAAFDPRRSFEGDLRPSSDDELILTAWASARDDYAPAYSLAVAYRCVPTQTTSEWRCSYVARMLRTALTISDGTDRSLELFAQARTASASEMRARLDSGVVQWLEANVNSCPGGIFAMDSVRVADWNPDIHYALQAPEDRDIILHPAAIRVMMHGSYTTTVYDGWVSASGVPAAVQHLIETLEPCWVLGTSTHPWDRPDR